MLARVKYDATRVMALVTALEQHEITLGEFSDGIGALTPEAIQLTSALLRHWPAVDSVNDAPVSAAACFCSHLASRTRILS